MTLILYIQANWYFKEIHRHDIRVQHPIQPPNTKFELISIKFPLKSNYINKNTSRA